MKLVRSKRSVSEEDRNKLVYLEVEYSGKPTNQLIEEIYNEPEPLCSKLCEKPMMQECVQDVDGDRDEDN